MNFSLHYNLIVPCCVIFTWLFKYCPNNIYYKDHSFSKEELMDS